MPRLRFLTAGESHGPALVAIVEGLPAGLVLDRAALDRDLGRRQMGYGRGGRMKIEKDQIEVLAGLRGGRTTGAPLAFCIRNRDFDNWRETMDPWAEPASGKEVTRPRPGHSDLAGALKYQTHDARDVLERASARNTATRVAIGAIAKQLLGGFGIELAAHVVRIGEVAAAPDRSDLAALRARAEASDVRCADPSACVKMKAHIDQARRAGDSLGGVFEVIATGVPPGLGAYAEWDLRLDGRLSGALASVQAMKGVEIGLGFESASRPGSEVHDPIHYENGRFVRPSNRAGGIEAGISNGEPIVVRVAMKPIPTLARPLASVDLVTKQPFDAAKERTDSVAVPAAAVVGEAVVATVLCEAFLEKFGGDTVEDVRAAYETYAARLRSY